MRSARPDVSATNTWTSPPLASPADVADPVAETPAELGRGLARDVPRRRVRGGRRLARRRAFGDRVVDGQRGERLRLGEPAAGDVPGHLELPGGRRRVAALVRVGPARVQPLLRPPEALLGVDGLRDDEARPGAFGVVAEHGAAIEPPFTVAGRLELIAQRHRGHPIQRRDGALRGGIEAAQRLDGVARELHPHGVRIAGRKEVDDAPAAAELPVRLDRIGVTESGVREPVGQVARRRRAADFQIDHRPEQPLRGAQAREDGRRRRHHHSRPAAGEGGEGAGAGGEDAHVGRDAAVRIYLPGGERQDTAVEVHLAQSLQGAQVEAHVGGHLVDVGVARHDQHHRSRPGERGRRERLGGRRHSRERVAAPGRSAGEPGAPRRVVQQRPQRQRTGDRRHGITIRRRGVPAAARSGRSG